MKRKGKYNLIFEFIPGKTLNEVNKILTDSFEKIRKYKGVLLDYGYSIDNIAYGNGISNSGLQRGTTVITLYSDGTFNQVHKNAYLDYGCETDRFVDVYLDHVLYPDMYRTYNK